jgi:phosphotransferase system enzyme I (PtsP)
MLDVLRRIVQEVSAAPDLEAALSVIVDRVKAAMAVDVCSVYLQDKTRRDYVLMATEGLNQQAVGLVRLPAGEGLVSMVAEREEPVNVEDAPGHERYRYFPEADEAHYHAFLGVPVIHHRQVMGVLVVQQRAMRRFAGEEESFLVTTAAQLAGAIAHAQIVGEVDALMASRGRTEGALDGLPGAPGIALGEIMVVYPAADLDAVPDRVIDDIENEVGVFQGAVIRVKHDIEEMSRRLPREDKALFDAYLMMLDSDSIVGKTIQRIREGSWASGALRATINEHARIFDEMDDPYLRERAHDVRDLGRRILMCLQSGERSTPPYPDNTILVGDEISATMLAEVPHERLAGVVSIRGSSVSHVAILAKALGIPAVVGVDDLPVSRIDHCEAVVDGYRGRIYLSPSRAVRKEYQRLASEEAELTAGLEELRDEPAETVDGYRVPLYANTGLISDLVPSLNCGAEGIGLHRTEFPFMVRDRFPGEDEQCETYRQILEAFAPRQVVLRTLDIGGDKSLSYFPIKEDNPFLGWRGIRVTLDHPEIFLAQLRAMLRAAIGLDNLHILFPMVSSLDEVDEAVGLLKRAYDELLDDGAAVTMPRVGVMIEVPSAVYLMDAMARRVDFFSIGTNDLTQYLLAVDRNNVQVASLYDFLHPAVLAAVHHTVETAHRNGKPVGVCGEMAGDPAAVILLLAMGVDSLSMSVSSLARIKWVVRNVSRQQTQQSLAAVLQMDDAREIRAHLDGLLEARGLGGLVRAGK